MFQPKGSHPWPAREQTRRERPVGRDADDRMRAPVIQQHRLKEHQQAGRHKERSCCCPDRLSAFAQPEEDGDQQASQREPSQQLHDRPRVDIPLIAATASSWRRSKLYQEPSLTGAGR